VRGLQAAAPREPSPNERLLSTLEDLATRTPAPTATSKHTHIPLKPLRPDTSKSFRKKKREGDSRKSKEARESRSKRRLLADYAIDDAGGPQAGDSSPRLRKLTTEEVIKLDFRKSIEKVSKGS
jgi:hypothetical protein